MSALRPRRELRTIVFVLDGSVARADVQALCERLQAALESADADVVMCDVGTLARPDAVAVDALARLQLTARRRGYQLRLRDASPELQALLAFMGLSSVVQVGVASGPRPKPEEREQVLGVEERVESEDPPV